MFVGDKPGQNIFILLLICTASMKKIFVFVIQLEHRLNLPFKM